MCLSSLPNATRVDTTTRGWIQYYICGVGGRGVDSDLMYFMETLRDAFLLLKRVCVGFEYSSLRVTIAGSTREWFMILNSLASVALVCRCFDRLVPDI